MFSFSSATLPASIPASLYTARFTVGNQNWWLINHVSGHLQWRFRTRNALPPHSVLPKIAQNQTERKKATHSLTEWAGRHSFAFSFTLLGGMFFSECCFGKMLPLATGHDLVSLPQGEGVLAFRKQRFRWNGTVENTRDKFVATRLGSGAEEERLREREKNPSNDQP